MQTIIYILPELFLSLVIMSLLMVGVFVKKSFKIVSLLANFSLLFAIILVFNQPSEIIKSYELIINIIPSVEARIIIGYSILSILLFLM